MHFANANRMRALISLNAGFISSGHVHRCTARILSLERCNAK
jgi:hypothetical protein